MNYRYLHAPHTQSVEAPRLVRTAPFGDQSPLLFFAKKPSQEAMKDPEQLKQIVEAFQDPEVNSCVCGSHFNRSSVLSTSY